MNAFRRALREFFHQPPEVDTRPLDVAQARAETAAARAELAAVRDKLTAAETELARRSAGLPVDLDVFRRRNGRALREIQAVVDGGSGRWRCSVPGRPGYDTDSIVNAALFDEQNLMREVGQLRELVTEILGHFTQPGHPGEPCRRTPWTSEKQLAAWRQAAGPSYATGSAVEHQEEADANA